jgi:hypothetical protein
MTIAGMAIVIVQLWREVGPLRNEVTARRAEMGELFITDPNKAHAIGVDWNRDGVWRWRLYLPERPHRGNTWAVRTYFGNQAAFPSEDLEDWLAAIRAGERRQWSSIGGIRDGETTFEILLAKDGDGWFLQDESDGAKERVPKAFNAWLDEPDQWFPISKVLSSSQTVYENGEPIVLLCIQRANDSRTNSAGADTIVVWIEEHH